LREFLVLVSQPGDLVAVGPQLLAERVSGGAFDGGQVPGRPVVVSRSRVFSSRSWGWRYSQDRDTPAVSASRRKVTGSPRRARRCRAFVARRRVASCLACAAETVDPVGHSRRLPVGAASTNSNEPSGAATKPPPGHHLAVGRSFHVAPLTALGLKVVSAVRQARTTYPGQLGRAKAAEDMHPNENDRGADNVEHAIGIAVVVKREGRVMQTLES
jgi:hypothetical protein